MVEKKSIVINPSFLNIKSGRKSKTMKRERKRKPSIKANTIKRDLKQNLINKVKNYQKKEKEKKRNQEKIVGGDKEQDNDNFENEFKDSLEFLENKINQKKEKKKKRKDLLSTPPEQNEISSLTEVSNIIVKNDVPYGILKGGKKPTYRQYIKNKNFSMKNNIHMKNKSSLKIESIPNNEEFEERKSNLNNFKQDFLIKHNVIDLSNQNKKQKSNFKLSEKYIRRKKTRTRRNLGKKGGKIGILIKNNSTRKKIETDQEILKTSSLKDIKQHLRKRGLLKIGSSAPPDILRKIYEDSFLTGEIYNKNTGVLIHNYLNEENE